MNWMQMDRERRYGAASLLRARIPVAPGVYAWYRNGSRAYVGKATSLQNRIGSNHLGRGVCMMHDEFRVSTKRRGTLRHRQRGGHKGP
jgi:hypothetical protein